MALKVRYYHERKIEGTPKSLRANPTGICR
nr:MAG TPA: hypothetical protein [Caudoviricetes sp.]